VTDDDCAVVVSKVTLPCTPNPCGVGGARFAFGLVTGVPGVTFGVPYGIPAFAGDGATAGASFPSAG
jgi:hypothetical protein